MQSTVRLAIIGLLSLATLPACAAGIDDKIPDQQSIDALEAKALAAQPREQCFLSGDADKASALLKDIQGFAHKIHLSVSDDNKRLKNAEILLRHTAFRLSEMLHNSSLEDRPLVAETLATVNKAETDAMMQVFRK
jgi:hypothetical protein